MNSIQFGYLRETEEQAQKAGVHKITKIGRTGMETYLKIIFPNITDWIHNQRVPNLIYENKLRKFMPDYRSETLKLIIEIDGIDHYNNPKSIENDKEKDKVYFANGYKVIHIPFFIQLSNKVVKKLFNVDVDTELFDENIPSLFVEDSCTPEFLCPLGADRMMKEFKEISIEQYNVNKNYLLSNYNNNSLSGLRFFA